VKKNLAILTILLVFTSCAKIRKPDLLLSEDKLINVLIDVQITEGIVSSLPVSYDSSQVLYRLLEQEIFLKHQVEDSVFTQSLIYYMQNPANMDRIYSRVIDSLSVRETTKGTEERF
jgi:hypothetical protein